MIFYREMKFAQSLILPLARKVQLHLNFDGMRTVFLDAVIIEREQSRRDVTGERSNGLRLSLLVHSHDVSQVLKQKPVRVSI